VNIAEKLPIPGEASDKISTGQRLEHVADPDHGTHGNLGRVTQEVLKDATAVDGSSCAGLEEEVRQIRGESSQEYARCESGTQQDQRRERNA